MKTVERFSNRVENYVKYRPTYPAQVLDLFRDRMNLQNDSTIADIAQAPEFPRNFFSKTTTRFSA
jgi:hypothetical protein